MAESASPNSRQNRCAGIGVHDDPEYAGAFKSRDGRSAPLLTRGLGCRAFSGQVVVMVDEGSESSSEIFAAAMMESRRGCVVGQITGGKILSATTKRLPQNFQMLLPIHNYKTASGRILEGVGLLPEVLVAQNLEMERKLRDPDLEQAIQRLAASASRLK